MTKARAPRNPTKVVVGVVVLLAGLLFMFQGLGAVKGSSMTNSNFWAAAGPIIAACGLALVISGARRRPSDTP